MTPFQTLQAIAASLPLENVDTDKILAGRFLKTISRDGLGKVLFAELRQEPNFVLNVRPWSEAGILIALDNFGCGSSREHAPWALLDFGIRCIIAPSFADIFYNNCFKNGILPVMLPRDTVNELMMLAQVSSTAVMTINLQTQTIVAYDRAIQFEIDTKRKSDLMGGVDDITRALGLTAEISEFCARKHREKSWLRPAAYSVVETGG